MSHRFGWTTKPWTRENAGENVVLRPERLKDPYHWRTPRLVFVDSMFDLFHSEIPDDYLVSVFQVMNDLPRHTFQILTKRSERAAAWPGPWAENIWMGTSVENRQVLDRIDMLRECAAHTLFISFEPLLESLGELNMEGIHWVIVGGESGPGHRPMDHAWAREIRDQCVRDGIAFWFKQSDGRKPGTGKELIEEDGSKGIWEQYPDTKRPLEQLSLF